MTTAQPPQADLRVPSSPCTFDHGTASQICPSAARPHAPRQLSARTMHFYLVHLVFPFSPHFSQAQKTSLFVASPPLALVAMSPTLRLYCEREKPYRLGGAWFLSHAHTWQQQPHDDSDTSASASSSSSSCEASGETDAANTSRTSRFGTKRDAGRADEDDDGDVAWAGARTHAGLTMGSLPAHLGSVRLFQYLENTPSSWIGFCTTVARGLRADVERVKAAMRSDACATRHGTPAGSAPALLPPPRLSTMTPSRAGAAPCACYLYLVCTHPEGRLAVSLWWTNARARHIESDYTRPSHAGTRGAADATIASSSWGPVAVSALVVCADLTYFSRVEKSDKYPVHTASEEDNEMPLLSYVFLNGPVTLAVEEELQQQWWASHVVRHTPSPPTAALTTTISEDQAAAPRSPEASDDESVLADGFVEPLLADCEDPDADSTAAASGMRETTTTTTRAQFDPAVAFSVCTQLHVLHLRVELAELTCLAWRPRGPAEGHTFDVLGAGGSGGERALGRWDVAWLARLFPHVVQLRVDGPPPPDAVIGRGMRFGHTRAHSDHRAGPRITRVPRHAVDIATSHHSARAGARPMPTTIDTISGLKRFASLHALYLHNVYIATLPLSVSSPPPAHDDVSRMEEGTARAFDDECAMPASLMELSVVGNAVLEERGLLPWQRTNETLHAHNSESTDVCGGAASDKASALALRVLSLVSVPRLSRVDVVLSHLAASAATLTHLELNKTSVNSQALRAAQLAERTPLLSVLRLTATPVDDVNFLRALTRLEVLNVSSSAITPAGLTDVPFFPSLRELYLMQCRALVPQVTSAQHVGGDDDGEVRKVSHRAADASDTSSSPTTHVNTTLAAVLGAALASRAAEPGSGNAAARPFPSLVFLDLSNNLLLRETHIFPTTACCEALLRRHPRVRFVDPAEGGSQRTRGRRCAVPPCPLFPAMQRLSLMHTAVSSLGLLPWLAPQLQALDASYTSLTSAGLWATPLACPAALAAAHSPSPSPARRQLEGSAEAFTFVVPHPLRLVSVALTGTPITSLEALNPTYVPCDLSPVVRETATEAQPDSAQHDHHSGASAPATTTSVPEANARVAHHVHPQAAPPPRAVGVLWLPALAQLRLNDSDITPEGMVAGFIGSRGHLRTLSLANTVVIAPPIRNTMTVPSSPSSGAAANTGLAPDPAVTVARLRTSRMTFTSQSRKQMDRVAQADAAAGIQMLLSLHPTLGFEWLHNDPARALWTSLLANQHTLTSLDLSHTEVELEAFFQPRTSPARVASAIQFVLSEAPVICSEGQQTGHSASSAHALIRLLSTASDDAPEQTPSSAVAGQPWHVLLWRLVLSGQLLERRFPSLRLTQCTLTDTPIATLIAEQIVAPARVQSATLAVALAAFTPAWGSSAHVVPAAGVGSGTLTATSTPMAATDAFASLWSASVVPSQIWRRLERLSERDVRGIEWVVKETLLGAQCMQI